MEMVALLPRLNVSIATKSCSNCFEGVVLTICSMAGALNCQVQVAKLTQLSYWEMKARGANKFALTLTA